MGTRKTSQPLLGRLHFHLLHSFSAVKLMRLTLVAITLKIAGKEKKLPLSHIGKKPYQSTLPKIKDKILGRHHQAFPSGDLNINQTWDDILGSQAQTTRKHYFIAPDLSGWKLQSWP